MPGLRWLVPLRRQQASLLGELLRHASAAWLRLSRSCLTVRLRKPYCVKSEEISQYDSKGTHHW